MGTVNGSEVTDTVGAPIGVVACISCGQPNPTRYHSGGSPRCPDCRATGLLS